MRQLQTCGVEHLVHRTVHGGPVLPSERTVPGRPLIQLSEASHDPPHTTCSRVHDCRFTWPHVRQARIQSLYFWAPCSQAAAYQSGGVVATLRALVAPSPPATGLRFSSEREVLAFVGNRLLAPIWVDPVCGDGKCEAPWEFPAWGRFGCHADCGAHPSTRQMVVAVLADFTGHPTLSASVLMANVRWNLCYQDDARQARGEAHLCWWVGRRRQGQLVHCRDSIVMHGRDSMAGTDSSSARAL